MTQDPYRLCGSAIDVDHSLRDIGKQVLLIPALHPRNAPDVRAALLHGRHSALPEFEYRALRYDPLELLSIVQKIQARTPRIHSPWLRAVYRDKCIELRRKLQLVAARGRPEFLAISRRLYRPPTRTMVRDAQVLSGLPHREEERSLSRGDLEKALRATLRGYRRQHSSFRCKLRWVDASLADASVGDEILNIRQEPFYSRRFLLVLEHHEIGIHLVTAQNGDRQKLNIFRGGLAGYDETQEGLALFAEFMTGAISTNRLRTLGARVLAVDWMCRGATLPEVLAALERKLGFSTDDALSIALRCFRGGGYTKDAIYQPGFLKVFNYWMDGGDLVPLFVGKFPLSQVRHVRACLREGLLRPPTFLPEFLRDEGRLHAERTIISLLRHRRGHLSSVGVLAKEEQREEDREERREEERESARTGPQEA